MITKAKKASARKPRDAAYGKRLEKALKDMGVSRGDLMRHLDVSHQAIGAVLSGASNAFTADNSARAARFMGVDHYWLATGEGDMRALSPLALDLAQAFDRIPDEKREGAYASVIFTIEQAIAAQQPTGETENQATGQHRAGS